MRPDPAAVVTARSGLRLRRPTADDAAAAYRVHGDPRTNRHNPSGHDRDPGESAQRLAEWVDHWERHGFGYWAVEAPGNGAVIGFAGVRHETWLGVAVLNLYYRFSPEHWGRGYAGEVAQEAVALAAALAPDTPVLARTTADNLGSQATARAAGLVRRPDLDREVDGVASVILVSHWPDPPPTGAREG